MERRIKVALFTSILQTVAQAVLIRLVDHLLDNRGLNPVLGSIINSSAVHIIPSADPDGYLSFLPSYFAFRLDVLMLRRLNNITYGDCFNTTISSTNHSANVMCCPVCMHACL